MEGEVISPTFDTSNIEELISKVIENQEIIIDRLNFLNGIVVFLIVILILGFIYRLIRNTITFG